jgi:16S rRNA (uracil1498-N3)-methyltransferase
MRRIYQPFSDPIVGSVYALNENAHHHLFTVLRCQEGETIEVFNGKGEAWRAKMIQLVKKQGQIELLEPMTAVVESPLKLHLVQAVSKGDRMDLVMQKATELGVTEITPILTERGNVKLDKDRWDKKIAHWEQIIIHACEQSGRTTVPQLNPVIEFKHWLTQDRAGLCLVLSPHGGQSLSALETPEQVTLLIGPEGGLTEQEIQFAVDRFHFTAIQLGPRVLRTETAAITALSILQYHWGDLGSP